jgi:glycosyltransferase involved in cell wall biosynthesis
MAPPAGPVARTPYPSVRVLGRLVAHKRVELALEAAARIRPHLPGLRVLVAGQGYWEPRLCEAVDRLGLGDAVELLGRVDEETKQRLLASSWALAMPSVKEGWGLEAAANGTPTVAFRAAGGLRQAEEDLDPVEWAARSATGAQSTRS